jgi:hypothetical protein
VPKKGLELSMLLLLQEDLLQLLFGLPGGVLSSVTPLSSNPLFTDAIGALLRERGSGAPALSSTTPFWALCRSSPLSSHSLL